jgi:hypothetical protein
MKIFNAIYLDGGITIWKKDARAISLGLVLRNSSSTFCVYIHRQHQPKL